MPCPPEWRGRHLTLDIPYVEGAVSLRASGAEAQTLDEEGLVTGAVLDVRLRVASLRTQRVAFA